MANEVPWNKAILERFIEEAMLTEDEELVIRTRIEGWSIVRQAEELRMSVSKVNKIISRLKKKYDNVAKYDDMLPKRTKKVWKK